jgi:hypothetical protein
MYLVPAINPKTGTKYRGIPVFCKLLKKFRPEIPSFRDRHLI